MRQTINYYKNITFAIDNTSRKATGIEMNANIKECLLVENEILKVKAFPISLGPFKLS